MARVPGTGDRLGGLTVGAPVHAGAMSSLYEVTGGDRPLLMKVPRAGASSEDLLAFETEATVLAALSGPHVPQLVAAGDVIESPYVVMERIAGTDLAEIAGRGPCPIAQVAAIAAAIADALYDVHGQGAIHLDLKPENIIVRPDGAVVLIDFGLAHHQGHADLLAEELRHQAGSAPYLSPEQLRGDRSDPRSDLFALGVILYELATGVLPFGTPETRAGLHDRLWRAPAPPRALREDVPPWLQEVILRCLEIDAGARYQSAAHVAFDLRNPEQVALTDRAGRVRGPALSAQLRSWWRARKPAPPRPVAQATPVIMVAVDTSHPQDPRQPALQASTRRLLALYSELRLLCVAVVPGGGPGDGERHLEHLARLRQWVQPLGQPQAGQSLHVIEADSPTAAILELARANHVDLLVLGAPGPEQSLAWWRSVASGVAAGAPCSVHLVRAPAGTA